MGHYYVALTVRDAKKGFDTEAERDAAFIKVRDILMSWGITTANASLSKQNQEDVVSAQFVSVVVPPEEQLPSPIV